MYFIHFLLEEGGFQIPVGPISKNPMSLQEEKLYSPVLKICGLVWFRGYTLTVFSLLTA